MLPSILPGLHSKIPIERLYATFKCSPAMLRAENFDPQRIAGRSTHASDAGSLAVTTHSIAQTIANRVWIDQGLDVGLAVTDRQINALVLFDRAAGRFLNTGQHEIRHRPALQRGSMFDEALLVSRDACLQAFATNTVAVWFQSWVGHDLSPRTNVRPLAGHFKAGVPS
jgi:hypothetical protein